LPIAIGEATKLASILVNAKKRYEFTIQFGAETDTADASGRILRSTLNIPDKHNCYAVCSNFIGKIEQIPPSYSALKINGQPAYKLARQGKEVNLKKRIVQIFNLKCIDYDAKAKTACYVCDCSKGTYIRTLAEDISLSLQSLGFVIELRRLRVGIFDSETAINISSLQDKNPEEVRKSLSDKCLKIESVLDDIPVLDATDDQMRKIRFGQTCYFDLENDFELAWVRHDETIVAIGSLYQKSFKSSRVFNI
jgi:tRNA pseudouridine55 synthase